MGAPNAIHRPDRGASIRQLRLHLRRPGTSSAPTTTVAAPIPFSARPPCTRCELADLPRTEYRLPPDANIVWDRVHPTLLAKYSRPWHTLFCVPRPARGFTPQDFGIFHRGCRQGEPNLNSRETLSRVFFSQRSTPPTAPLISWTTCPSHNLSCPATICQNWQGED